MKGVRFHSSLGTKLRLHVLFLINRDVAIAPDNTGLERAHVERRIKGLEPEGLSGPRKGCKGSLNASPRNVRSKYPAMPRKRREPAP